MKDDPIESVNDLWLGDLSTLSIEELEERLSAEGLEERAVMSCWVHCACECLSDSPPFKCP